MCSHELPPCTCSTHPERNSPNFAHDWECKRLSDGALSRYTELPLPTCDQNGCDLQSTRACGTERRMLCEYHAGLSAGRQLSAKRTEPSKAADELAAMPEWDKDYEPSLDESGV